MYLLMLAAWRPVIAWPGRLTPRAWHYDIVTINFWMGQVISRRLDGSQKVGIRPALGGQLRRL